MNIRSLIFSFRSIFVGRVLAVCSALPVLFSLCLQAQQATPSDNQPQAPAPVPSIRTQANLVLFDVVVSANNNTPVHGLTKDRFHILDNGVPQQVTVFEEHKFEEAPAPGKPLDLGPNTYSNLQEPPKASAVNVLLLDALNTPVADQLQSRHQMIDYLKNVPPGTRIAVFSLASRLRMVSGFTTNAGALVASLESKKATPQNPVGVGAQFNQALGDQLTEMTAMGGDPQAMASFQQFLADDAAFQTDMRVGMTLDALQSLARYLNEIPGRKNLIWFSGSFPLAIDGDPSLSSPFEAMRAYSDQVRLTDEMLSAARVAVYPVDARGIILPPSMDASNNYQSTTTGLPSGGGGGRRSGGMGGGGGLGGSAKNNSASAAAIKADNTAIQTTAQEHATMQQIAQETGGEAFLNTNGLKEAIAQIVNKGSNYYTIGYVPTFKNYDGSFHRLKVTADGQSKLEYRQGYYADDLAHAKTKPQVAQHLMASALEQGAPPLSELIFKVRVQPVDTPAATATPAAKQTVNFKGPAKHYTIDFGIPVRLLDFKTADDGVRHARLEFALVAYDPDGKRLNFIDQNANFDFPPDLYAKAQQFGLPVHQEIDLPVGQVFLRVVIHDLGTEHVGAIEVPLNVTK
jgi:VWFA-related protein